MQLHFISCRSSIAAGTPRLVCLPVNVCTAARSRCHFFCKYTGNEKNSLDQNFSLNRYTRTSIHKNKVTVLRRLPCFVLCVISILTADIFRIGHNPSLNINRFYPTFSFPQSVLLSLPFPLLLHYPWDLSFLVFSR